LGLTCRFDIRRNGGPAASALLAAENPSLHGFGRDIAPVRKRGTKKRVISRMVNSILMAGAD
jgi:hypothetical protein